ncbi:hypothetical protein BJ944DRAFT_262775 [Cunninghamella echinulata]|nr:hypothetical protein BJ944DRAFT_262775 [Cunninghamella echinulata]
MDNNTNENRWTSVASNRDRAGEATRTFITHIQNYFTSLSFVAFAAFLTTLCATLIDFLALLGSYHTPFLFDWFSLSINKVLYHFQIYRLILYPIVNIHISLLITNLIIVIPYISKHERRYGSLRTLYELGVLFTLIPGVMYIIAMGLITGFTTYKYIDISGCSGLSGWAVGLSLLTMLHEQSEGIETDHSLFGVVPIPSRMVPGFIFAFYLFLVPDSSIILNLSSALIAYLYATKRLSSKILPLEDTYRHYENHALFKSLTTFRNFISIDSIGYLPVASTNVPIVTAATSSSTNSAPFPGQGHRLGD